MYKKILLLVIIITLTGCRMNDGGVLRVEENPDYLSDLTNEYGIKEVQMVFLEYYNIARYYYDFYNIEVNIEDDKDGVEIVFGIDQDNDLKTLLIPQKSNYPVKEIPNNFPLWNQIESEISIFNEHPDYPEITKYQDDDYPYSGVEVTNKINDHTEDQIHSDFASPMMLIIGSYESSKVGMSTVYLVHLSNDTYSFIANSNLGRTYGYEILSEFTIEE